MTASEKTLKEYAKKISEEAEHKFRTRIFEAVNDLYPDLEFSLLEDYEKQDYVTHVFALSLDFLTDRLETKNFDKIN